MVVRNKKKTSIHIPDLSDVEGKRAKLKPGEYPVKVVEVEQKTGDEHDYYAWKFEVTGGKSKGAELYYNTSLSPNALWNLRGLLEALGVDIPDDEFDLEKDELIDLEMIAVVDEEEYKGKTQSKMVDFLPADGEAEEPEEEKKKGAKKTTAKKGAAKKVNIDEVTDASQEELDDIIGENDLEVDLSKIKTLRKMRDAVVDALREADKLDE